MQFFTAALALFAAGAAAAPTAGTFEVVFEEYNNGDRQCSDANAYSSFVVNSKSDVGKCLSTAAGTSSINVRVPAYAQEVNGCKATFFVDNQCKTPYEGFSINNGDLQCAAPPTNYPGWGSVQIDC